MNVCCFFVAKFPKLNNISEWDVYTVNTAHENNKATAQSY